MGFWHRRQRLNLLRHSASPCLGLDCALQLQSQHPVGQHPSVHRERSLFFRERKNKGTGGCKGEGGNQLQAHPPVSPGAGFPGWNVCSKHILQGQGSFLLPLLLRSQKTKASIHSVKHGLTKAGRHLANTKISALRRFIHQVPDSSRAHGSGRKEGRGKDGAGPGVYPAHGRFLPCTGGPGLALRFQEGSAWQVLSWAGMWTSQRMTVAAEPTMPDGERITLHQAPRLHWPARPCPPLPLLTDS